MAGKETKQEERARIIAHKQNKEEWKRKMKVWNALTKQYQDGPVRFGRYKLPETR